MKKSNNKVVISVIALNGNVIGTVGSLIKNTEDNESIIYECNRFCFNNLSIAEYFQDKKKFSILVQTTIETGKHIEKSEQCQDNCFIEDHSFCHSPSVANTVRVKAYKNAYNGQDTVQYEKWLENRFIW